MTTELDYSTSLYNTTATQVDLTIPIIVTWCIIMIFSVSLIYLLHKYNINVVRDLKRGLLQDEEESENETD